LFGQWIVVFDWGFEGFIHGAAVGVRCDKLRFIAVPKAAGFVLTFLVFDE
jgi:hypothetical protein